MSSLMCNDPDQAKANRERIASGETNRFYDQQARAIAQWPLGEPKPESVVLGELPYIGKIKIDAEVNHGIYKLRN